MLMRNYARGRGRYFRMVTFPFRFNLRVKIPDIFGADGDIADKRLFTESAREATRQFLDATKFLVLSAFMYYRLHYCFPPDALVLCLMLRDDSWISRLRLT